MMRVSIFGTKFASWDNVRGRLLLMTLLLCLAFSACSLEALIAPTATPKPTDTAIPPTATNTATATDTATTTATPTFTDTLTNTPTATATASPTPSATPTVFGIVRSQRRANVRRGPGTNFAVFNALAPGSGVMILGTSDDEDWYNVRLENGVDGWISAGLIEIEEPPTPESEAITISGETRVLVEVVGSETDDAESAEDGLLVFNVQVADIDSMNLTATVLVAATTAAAPATATSQATETAPPTDTPAVPTAPPRFDVNVFAFCDDASFGIGRPTDLSPGSTIKIFWAWFASTDAYLRDHMANATHDLRVNGEAIPNVNQYRGNPRASGSQQVVYWHVPYGPLAAGEHTITYRVTWRKAISDGYANYGPGAAIEFEEESCTFDVR